MKNVVVIGGGHGQSAVLRGLKLCNGINLTAIVTVADDGGSTGRLRREFNIPAMGDIRGVMCALADEETLLTELMEYRFEDEKHGEMDGHNVGNIILTALTKSSGSFMDAVTKISKVLNVKGNIVPSTTEVITLYAVMEDGTIVKGESNIPRVRNKIQRVYYDHDVKATSLAIKSIQDADFIVYGIGSLYTSILPNVIISDIRKAIKNSKAKKIYFCNCMTQSGETEDYSLEDHVDAIEKATDDQIDLVYYASDEIPNEILERYEKEQAQAVKINSKEHKYEVVEEKMLDFSRGKVRHDSKRIKEVFQKEIDAK